MKTQIMKNFFFPMDPQLYPYLTNIVLVKEFEKRIYSAEYDLQISRFHQVYGRMGKMVATQGLSGGTGP